MKPRLFRASYLLWIIVPLALFGAKETFGLPHVRTSYSWVDEGQGMDPFTRRFYTKCLFWGPYGGYTIHPTDGHCAWVRFFKPDGNR
ncbi:MAG: hypothetical protein COA47_14345 [Robiginitomaculum sp.]|nr:MAG: hypothetical protein COA47_14345 [Robiginitomaculum sp.]